MAVRKDALPEFERAFATKMFSGRVMIFGRPTLMWEDAPTPEEFYKKMGFSEVHTLDISPYEGASHIHDLNNPNPPPGLEGQYNFVNAGGMLEHVFNWMNALKTAFYLLQEGGTLIFGSPMNNWIDHGFYQFSPTLKFDYFAENGWEFGVSRASFYCQDGGIRRSIPLYPGEGSRLNFVRGRVSHVLHATKVAGSTCGRIPKQGVYAMKHEGERRQFRFQASGPYESKGGEICTPMMQRFALDRARIKSPWHGGGYVVPFRQEGMFGSMAARPFRSRALVYEDGKLLKWIVSDPQMVAERPDSFAHFGGQIHFSASDGSDPRQNGKKYEVAFPSYPWLEERS